MATAKADVCRGDVPTPGWVRLAQRNLAKVRVGDQLPDACVRYAEMARLVYVFIRGSLV